MSLYNSPADNRKSRKELLSKGTVPFEFVEQIVRMSRNLNGAQEDSRHFIQRAQERGISLSELVSLQNDGELVGIEVDESREPHLLPKVYLRFSTRKGDDVIGLFATDGRSLKGITCYRCPRGVNF